ncbi:MAG: hypothetical protein ABW321_15315 [Polyangiales bacterium]
MSKGFDAEAKFGTLLDDPAAKEVLLKHLPQLQNPSPMLKLARGMSLKTIAGFPQAKIPPDKLEAIVAELVKL